MDKYKNKYRISSTRLKNWDYGSPGLYFITIKTKNNGHFFGKIINKKMVLNELGMVVCNEWIKTLDIRNDMDLELGEFVVMPDHFHGIVMIGGGCNCDNCFGRVAMHCVSTGTKTGTTANKFGPQSKNLASIMRGFKSSVTMYALKNKIEFGWQPLFHDHIIRNQNEFTRISDYIQNNPAKWTDEKFTTNNE